MAPFTHRFRIRYHECDAQGHVFNSNYFAFFDVGVTELWREAFPGGYTQMLDEHHVDMVVGEARRRFLGSARFDELVELDIEIVRFGATSTTSASRYAAATRCSSRASCATSTSTPSAGRRPRSPTRCGPRSRRTRAERCVTIRLWAFAVAVIFRCN